MDGISIIYGDPRHHIWSYIAGAYENRLYHKLSNCPCSSALGIGSQTSIVAAISTVNLLGNPTDSFPAVRIFTSDRLWDGEQCEGTCCSGTKSPSSLPHGSVYSFLPKHLIGLRCVFVLMSPLAMKMSSLNC